MHPPKIVWGVITLLCLTGCQHYQAKPLDSIATQQSLLLRSLDEPGLRTFISSQALPVRSEWDLPRLFLAGYYFSPELDIASGQIRTALGTRLTADDLPNPSASFTPGYNQDAVGAHPWSFGYALKLPLEIMSQRRLRQSGADVAIEAAQLNFARSRWSLWSTLRRHLIELHAAESVAQLWRDQQPLLNRATELVAAQVAAGEVSPLEATKAQVALHQTELNVRASERAVITARSHIAEAIGVPLTALDGRAISYRGLDTSSMPETLAELHASAAQHRLDLVQSLNRYAASQFALEQEIQRQWPDLSIGPGYNLDQGEGKWALSLDFTLPVFNQNQGPIAVAEARRESVAAEFLAVQNHALAEVDRAWSHYQSTRADLATIASLQTQFRRQTQLVEVLQAAGETSQLDVVRARIELAHGTRSALDAFIQVELALSALEDAVQNPYSLPLSSDQSIASRPRTSP